MIQFGTVPGTQWSKPGLVLYKTIVHSDTLPLSNNCVINQHSLLAEPKQNLTLILLWFNKFLVKRRYLISLLFWMNKTSLRQNEMWTVEPRYMSKKTNVARTSNKTKFWNASKESPRRVSQKSEKRPRGGPKTTWIQTIRQGLKRKDIKIDLSKDKQTLMKLFELMQDRR